MPPKAADDAAPAAQAAEERTQQPQPTKDAAGSDAGSTAAAAPVQRPRAVRPAAPEPMLGIQRSRILLSCAMYIIALAVLYQKVRLDGMETDAACCGAPGCGLAWCAVSQFACLHPNNKPPSATACSSGTTACCP